MSILSHWRIRYSIIKGTFRVIEVVAEDYNNSLTVFENKTGISKKNVMSSIRPPEYERINKNSLFSQ